MRAAQQGLAADNKQLGVPDFASILASGFLWHGVDGQLCLLQLKPDPLGGVRDALRATEPLRVQRWPATARTS